MILPNQTKAHRAHVVSQFENILPGFNSYRMKFGRGCGYAAMVFIDHRYYFSHDGKVFHYLRDLNRNASVPTHSIEIAEYRP